MTSILVHSSSHSHRLLSTQWRVPPDMPSNKTKANFITRFCYSEMIIIY